MEALNSTKFCLTYEFTLYCSWNHFTFLTKLRRFISWTSFELCKIRKRRMKRNFCLVKTLNKTLCTTVSFLSYGRHELYMAISRLEVLQESILLIKDIETIKWTDKILSFLITINHISLRIWQKLLALSRILHIPKFKFSRKFKLNLSKTNNYELWIAAIS